MSAKNPSTHPVTYPDLISWSAPGGGSFVTMKYDLQPANGTSTVKPQTVPNSDDKPTYIDGTRYVDGEAKHVYSLDSGASTINRMEEAYTRIVKDDNPEYADLRNLLEQVNGISVTFDSPSGDPGDTRVLLDSDMPGRGCDMQIRTATIKGETGLVDTKPWYRAMRSSYPDDVTALATNTPFSVLFGEWDAITPGGIKIPSLVTGETIGIDAEQTRNDRGSFIGSRNHAGGTRRDPFSAAYDKELVAHLASLGASGEVDLVSKLHGGDVGAKAKAKASAKSGTAKKEPAMSEYLLGSIIIGDGKTKGPTLTGGVACSAIVRTITIDLPNLRRLRFAGRTAAEQQQARAAFIALALLLDALVAENLVYRSGTVLGRIHGGDSMRHVASDGAETTTPALNVSQASALFEEALSHVKWMWNGTMIQCVGDPKFAENARTDSQSGDVQEGPEK